MASIDSAEATARRARSNLAAWAAVVRRVSTNSACSCPLFSSHWSSVRPWAWRRMAKSWRRCCISLLTRASGTSTSTSSASASLTFSRSDIWACILRTAVMRSARSSRSSASVSNSEASAAQASSGSGRTRSLTSLSETTKWRPSSSGSGCSASKSRSSPADAPTSASSSSAHDAGAADLVGVVLGGQALERLVALGALDVDGDVVALGRRTLDGGELGVLAAACARSGRRSPRRWPPALGMVMRRLS